MQNGEDRRPSLAELAERIVRLGRGGLSRVEIAAAIGVGAAALGRLEARSGRVAAALAKAAEAERAWWEAQPREALAAGARFNASAWRAAMGWRFGADAGLGAAGAGAAGAAGSRARGAAPAPAPEPRGTIYLIPDNGRARGPDGRTLPFEERLARSTRPLVEKIEQLERELDDWRARLRAFEADEREGEAEREAEGWDEDDDWDGEGDWTDEIDDSEGDDDEGDELERDGDGGDGEGDGDGGGGAGDPGPLAPGGASPSAGGGAEAGWFSADPAGCEWAVPAGGAGAAAWVAQPALEAGVADAAAGLRGRLR